jgi:16S rRNA (uracil1498-N3)-methyltransferase
MDDDFKLPRLFIDAPLAGGNAAPLTADQAHYLKNVLRRNDGDEVRVFNGRDGEWRGALTGLNKKGGLVALTAQLRIQPASARRVHLYFAPIKKAAMDWMIEKAVELGATDLHPVLTQNTEVRKLNDERLEKQIFEAAEQCERLEIPVFHPIKPILTSFEGKFPVLAAIERVETGEIGKLIPKNGDVGVFIGPEGGFTAEEKAFLTSKSGIIPVSLGETVLRAETAACYALVAVQVA